MVNRTPPADAQLDKLSDDVRLAARCRLPPAVAWFGTLNESRLVRAPSWVTSQGSQWAQTIFYSRHGCWGEPSLRADVDALLRLAFQPAPYLERGVVASGLLPAALASARAFETDLEPGQRIGSWRVVREIGRGGMGTVFLVDRVEGQFEQRGALKLVRSMAGSDARSSAHYAAER